MTLDVSRTWNTSGLCLVKTLSTALTCWPFRNTALRDGARTSTRTSSVAKGRTASPARELASEGGILRGLLVGRQRGRRDEATRGIAKGVSRCPRAVHDQRFW